MQIRHLSESRVVNSSIQNNLSGHSIITQVAIKPYEYCHRSGYESRKSDGVIIGYIGISLKKSKRTEDTG